MNEPADTRPHADDESRPKYAVPALEKALDVLEHLSEQAVPMTQAQLARALRREPSELFRMLSCLESRGYLQRLANGGYTLSLKLFELSRTHSPHELLLQAAVPLMRDLVDRVRESCHLCVLHREQVLVLHQVDSPTPIRLSIEAGSLHPPVHTVSGQVLLAHLPEAERDDLLSRQPDFLRLTPTERQALRERLARIAADGWAYTEGARFVGGLDLGVYVGSPRSRTRAVLTIAALKSRDGPDLFALLPRLRECAQAIAGTAGLL
ncbi:MAG: IclR family transcriptional regulator [Rubrivivax sp.]